MRRDISTSTTIRERLERVGDIIGPYIDPTNLSPEKRRTRRNAIFAVSFVVVMGTAGFNILVGSLRHGKCSSPPTGVAMMRISSAQGYDQKQGAVAARRFLADHPGATEVDVCTDDDGTIIGKFHPTGRGKPGA